MSAPRACQVDTLRPGLLGKHRNEFAARYCGRRLLCSRPGRSGAKHYDNSGVARPGELRGLLMKVLLETWWSALNGVLKWSALNGVCKLLWHDGNDIAL